MLVDDQPPVRRSMGAVGAMPTTCSEPGFLSKDPLDRQLQTAHWVRAAVTVVALYVVWYVSAVAEDGVCGDYQQPL